MSELIFSWLVLAAEAALGLTVLLIVISSVVVIRRRRRLSTAESMTDQLTSSVQRNQHDLQRELNGSEEYEQHGLEDRILELNKQEKRLYERILAIFRGDKSGLIEGVSEDVGALLDASKALYSPSKRSLLKERSAKKVLQQACMALKKENQTLKEELVATEQQLAQLKSEYAALYERMK